MFPYDIEDKSAGPGTPGAGRRGGVGGPPPRTDTGTEGRGPSKTDFVLVDFDTFFTRPSN